MHSPSGHHPARRNWRQIAALVLLPICASIIGCPPAEQPLTLHDETEALALVNNNFEGMKAPLYCRGLVSVKFHDAKGDVRRFIGHETTLIYQEPRCLYFDIKSLAGSAARIGSNDERYWLWIDLPDTRKLWHGRWDAVGQHATQKLPVPPNELLDALMLRPLPLTAEGALRPVLRKDGGDIRLVYTRLNADRQTAGLREVKLDSRAPYQPIEIIERKPDGRIAMHAKLGDYRQVGSDGPFTPRRYEIYWPISDAELRLDIHSAKFREDQPPFCDPPDPKTYQGEVDNLDAAPVAPGATQSPRGGAERK